MVTDVFGIVGTSLSGTFQVESVVAEGGFGVVYRAEHIAFRAPVALKCLKIPGTMTADQREAFVESFREEAEMLFHLSAQIPEVVRPLHADAIALPDGNFMPYIAMEWIDGKPLDSIVIMREDRGEKPLALRQVIKMLTPIAHALHRAHHFETPSGGIISVIHCDMKPENVLILERGPVPAKILDFGIAKARELARGKAGHITDSEAARPFTPSYGAPEQWVPKRFGVSGPWTDVWGLALTMVECLTGKPPIDGDLHAMMGTALDPRIRPTPKTEGADIPDAVDQVFRIALAVDPRERYQDIEGFWTDLERAFGAKSSFARAARRRQKDQYDEDTADASGKLPALVEAEDELSGKFDPVRDLGLEPRDFGHGTEMELDIDPAERSLRPGVVAGLGATVDSQGPPLRDADAIEFAPGDELDLAPGPDSAPGAEPTASPTPSAVPSSQPADAAAGASDSPLPQRASAAARPGQRAVVRTVEPEKRSNLAIALGVLALGFVLIVIDKTAGPVVLGPLKLIWLGALVAAVGMVLTLAGLVGGDDD